MANDEDPVRQLRAHQECWELLPWAANGRLSGADAARVNAHLQQCARCTEELHAQHQLYEAVRRDDPVLLAPQASLKKIWQRFDTGQEPSHRHAGGPHRGAARTPASFVAECVPVATHPAPAASPSRRLRIALAAQAFIIVGLLGWGGWQTQQRWLAPRYTTLSTPTEIRTHRPAVRVVFLANTPMAEITRLLRSVDAQILAGPSQADVFTLGLPPAQNSEAVARTAMQLRGDPRVRFAEATVVAAADK